MSEDQTNLSRDLDSDPNLAALRDKHTEGIMLGGVLLKSVIAEGGMGTVYKGFHTRLDIPVAVKILKPQHKQDWHMFLREARLTASIEHPNLVRVYDVNVEPQTKMNYIVMEYVEGCSAYQLLQTRMQQQKRPLAPIVALEIVCSAAKALGAAHERDIVHRDVKPENILIRSRDGEVRLTDLGLAGAFKTMATGTGRNTSMAGTTGFIAPEVVAGGDVSPASDVYGLSACLYELLTGELPHAGAPDDTYYSRQLHSDPIDPREFQPSLNPDVVKALMRGLSRNPKERFRDGNAMAAELEPLLKSMVGQRDTKQVSRDEELTSIRRPVVLCVDDDRSILDIEQDILESQGFQAVCLTDPLQAIRELAAIAPDVAVVDFNMPQMSGAELCQRLRKVEGYRGLAVLMLSGDGHSETIDQALRSGITDFLSKPIDFGELVARVKLLAQLRVMSREKKSGPARRGARAN